jgi:hypothetical protein
MAKKPRKASRSTRPPTPKTRRRATRIYKDLTFEASTTTPVDLPEFSALRRMEQRFEMSLGDPRVSVVIAARNEVDRLWHCLFALKTQSHPPHEVILVDNASADATVEFVRSNYPQVKVLECQEDFGRTMAVNLGAKTATGDLVVVMDPDVVVKPDWLHRLVKGFRANWPRFGVIASPLDEKQDDAQAGKEWAQTLNFLGRPVKGFWPDARLAFFPPRGGFLYPRFLAPEGPFEEDYRQGVDEAYLGWRMHLAGRYTGLVPDAKIFRSGGEEAPSEDPSWKKAYYRTRNRWLNLLLFLERPNLLKVLPWMGVEALALLLKNFFIVRFDSFLGVLLAAGWILTHPAWVMRQRHLFQEKRKTSDSAILRLVSGRILSDGTFLSRWVNFFSLLYCRVTGLKVLEWD